MKRRGTRPTPAADAAPAAAADSPWLLRTAFAILGVGIVFIPLYVARDAWDPWRGPKEIAFRAEAILLLLVAAFAATSQGAGLRDRLRQIPRREWILCAAVLAWTLITTVTSQNRFLSIDSAITVAAGIVIYLGTRFVAPHLRSYALLVALIPGLATSVLTTLQEFNIWNPYTFDDQIVGHTRTTGFMGNPNDVGTFLSASVVAAVAGFVALRGWPRWACGVAAALTTAGVMASGTRTAILAIAAGVGVLALMRPWRQALALVAAGVVVVLGALAGSPALRRNVEQLIDGVRSQNVQVFTSSRAVAFVAALQMARAHPVTGVGPGGFKYHFMPVTIEMQSTHPAVLRGWAVENFSETHNDHLQVLAEMGGPGYLLFLASIAMIASVYWRFFQHATPPATDESRISRTLALPLAVTFAVLCLAQFPLQIAAPRLMFLTLAALVTGWENRDG